MGNAFVITTFPIVRRQMYSQIVTTERNVFRLGLRIDPDAMKEADDLSTVIRVVVRLANHNPTGEFTLVACDVTFREIPADECRVVEHGDRVEAVAVGPRADLFDGHGSRRLSDPSRRASQQVGALPLEVFLKGLRCPKAPRTTGRRVSLR